MTTEITALFAHCNHYTANLHFNPETKLPPKSLKALYMLYALNSWLSVMELTAIGCGHWKYIYRNVIPLLKADLISDRVFPWSKSQRKKVTRYRITQKGRKYIEALSAHIEGEYALTVAQIEAKRAGKPFSRAIVLEKIGSNLPTNRHRKNINASPI